MKSSSFAITLLFAKVNALSLRRADAGVPVTVNPTLMNNTMGDVPLGLNMTVGPDSVQVSQQKLAQGVPVHVVPTLMTDTMHDAKLDMKIVVGPDEVELKKKQAAGVKLAQIENPVANPPFNNWSVNQPSPPHDHGLAGKADLGQNIIVDGHAVSF